MNFTIDELLKKAFYDEASDLHITVDAPPIYRLHGILTPYGEYALTKEDTEDMAKTVLGRHWESFVELGEFDFAYHIEGVARFRMNAFKQKGNISIAARVIATDIPTIEQLQMPTVLNDLALRAQGLILVTGPTGSGKSTTLAAMLDYVNRNNKKHIITLEDPVEYIHEHRQSIVQ